MLSACASSSQSCEERDEIYLGLNGAAKLVTDQDLRGACTVIPTLPSSALASLRRLSGILDGSRHCAALTRVTARSLCQSPGPASIRPPLRRTLDIL